MLDRSETCRQFLAAMQTRELALSDGKHLITDGEWQRCDATNKPNGKNDGSYKLCLDGPVPWGLFRNWTDGKGVDYWRGAPSRALTEAERQELERRMEQVRIEDEKRAAERAAKARDEAHTRWHLAKEAPANHPYLKRKKIKPHGVRVNDGLLLVPMYDPDDDDIVNLQIIDEDGCKWYLRGGRAKGCFFRIPGNLDLVVEAEGFATGASINESMGCWVAVAFSVSNLAAVAAMIRIELKDADAFIWNARQEAAAERGLQCERRQTLIDTKFVIAADDDWKTKDNPGLMGALKAARAAHALVAIPDFGKKRKDGETDFNDLACWEHGHKAVKACIDAAVEPDVLLEQRLLADPHSAHASAMVKELAGLKQHDPARYENLLAKLKKAGIRAAVLDRNVNAVIKADAARRAATHASNKPVEVDIDKLAASARDIIHAVDVLGLFAANFAELYAGEEANAKLLYLVGTSRLFERKKTMHAAVKGPSAVGKSALLSSVMAFMPPEDVITFTALSEKALLYTEGDFKHKILAMAEAPNNKHAQQFQDYLLRELMSEGKLRYHVPMKIDGEIRTITIEKEGPVAFLVTTTKNQLNPENETRMLSLEVDDSEKQTKRVLRKVAKIEGMNRGLDYSLVLAPWHDFQRWLAAGERRVFIPFAGELARLIPAKAVRLRRDLGQVLRAIKAHAVLHREHRRRSNKGSIIATIRDDYVAVRELMGGLLAETAGVKMRKTMAETIDAVVKVQPGDKSKGATVREIAKVLHLDKSAARRRLYAALDEGLIENIESRQGRPAQYRATGQRPQRGDVDILPSVNELLNAVRRKKDSANVVRAVPEYVARVHASSVRR
jgi:phage/plasmid primase-like uncharacterized protein/predicted transcriptional regulator